MIAGWLCSSLAFADAASNFLNLHVSESRYLGDVTSPSQTANYTTFAGDLNLETQSPGFTYKLNPTLLATAQSGQELYFGVPEAFLQPRKIAPWFSITIGRQRRQWSHLDEEFNLGVWQPQLRWDYLAPRQEGLTGVFFDWAVSSSLRFTFFTSPISIPDQGPQFHLENGQFSSANRWFVPPQTRLSLFGGTPFAGEAPLYWQLDRPSNDELIMHSSFGFGMSYQTDSPWWIHLNYAYKPLNQIHLGIACASCANLGSTPPLEVTAVIHPTIVNHNVVTLESGFDRVDDQGWLSVTGDFPNRSGFPSDYIEASLNPALIVGGAYQHYLVQTPFDTPSWLQYSYVRTIEFKRAGANGLVDQNDVESSLDRFPFKSVAAVEWKWLISQRTSQRVIWRNKYHYSIPERGGWWTSSFDWTDKDLTYTLGFDFLGSGVDTDSPDAGLLTRYRSNDRVYGGVSYVF